MSYAEAKSRRWSGQDPATLMANTHMDAADGRSAEARARQARRERLSHRLVAQLMPTWGQRSYSIAASVMDVLVEDDDV